MKLIVGLGNPGVRYEGTRHNAGFMAIDEVARKLDTSFSQQKFEARMAEAFVNGEKVLLMKPETFMNNSGFAIRQCMDYYRLQPEDLLILYDDLDTVPGQIRLRSKGSDGGHNGIKSVIAAAMTKDFNRIRIGIGRDPQIPIISYVLSKFKKDELPEVQKAVVKAADAAIETLYSPFDKVMSSYNTSKPAKPKKEKKSKALPEGVESFASSEQPELFQTAKADSPVSEADTRESLESEEPAWN